MRLFALVLIVALIAPVYTQHDFDSRRRKIVNQVNNLLDEVFGDDEEIKSEVKTLLNQRNFYDHKAVHHIDKNEVERRITHDYVKKYKEARREGLNPIVVPTNMRPSTVTEKSSVDRNLHRSIVQTFAGHTNNQFDAGLKFSQEKLEPAIGEIQNEQNNKAVFDKLLLSLESWVPNPKDFTDGFAQYLRSKNLSPAELATLDNHIVLLSSSNRHFQEFTKKNPELLSRTIDIQISAVLDSIDSGRVLRNFEILKKKASVVFQQLYDIFTLKSMIKLTIQPIQDCMAAMPARIEHILVEIGRNDEEKINMKEYFEANKCFADEICVKTNGNLTKVNTELQPYIDLYRKSRNDSLAANLYIKDEIDQSIYDVVQNVVESKGVDETLAECFSLFLRRTNDLDKIYSSNLLFDENQLITKIKPFVEKYEKDYIRSLFV